MTKQQNTEKIEKPTRIISEKTIPLTSAERSKRCRDRKELSSQPKRIPLTSAERSKKCRDRKELSSQPKRIPLTQAERSKKSRDKKKCRD